MQTKNLTLNYQPDVPTVNGRIYPKGLMENALDKAIKRGLPVYATTDGNEVNKNDITKAGAFVRGYQKKDGGIIILSVDICDNPYGMNIRGTIEAGCDTVTTAGVGRVGKLGGKDGVLVESMEYTGIYFPEDGK